MNRRKFLKLLGGLLPIPLVYPLVKREPGQLTVDALKAAGDIDLVPYDDSVTIDQARQNLSKWWAEDFDEHLLRALEADNE
jgi:hypothetical protein